MRSTVENAPWPTIMFGIGVLALIIGVLQYNQAANSQVSNENISATLISLQMTEVSIPTSLPQVTTQNTSLATATTEPQGPTITSLGTVRIFGNSNQGVQVQISETGIYRFSYRSGSYSTYGIGMSPSGVKTWLTAVHIFRGDSAKWEGRTISTEGLLAKMADTGYWFAESEAENAGDGKYTELYLNNGDILTLVAVDHFDAYADNPGQVVVELFYVIP